MSWDCFVDSSIEIGPIVDDIFDDDKIGNLTDFLPPPPKLSDKEIWKNILDESNERYSKLNEYIESKSTDETCRESFCPELKFLEEEVFPLLIPILEKTLEKAVKMECLKYQKSLFNGIDYISEMLWNRNKRHPERAGKQINIFLIPGIQEWLKNNPRPIFPLSWIWTKEIAAVKLQSYMRGHFVRRTAAVQEMRQFWKTLKKERLEEEAKQRKLLKEMEGEYEEAYEYEYEQSDI